jgi:Holliday junction resolvase RusA-like endonuclease
MKLTITSYRLKELDEDNLHAGAKILIDAIKDVRLIKDDSPKWIDLELRQEIGKEKHGTGIEIEEVKK